MTSPLSLKIYHSVDEVGETTWDKLSAGRPFQSAAWYRYGERVMDNCEPVYLVVFQENHPIARATFWVIREEPLPIPPDLNKRLKPIFRRWPLLICRSPISNSSGLILPDPPVQGETLRLISREAEQQARQLHCSFLIFDFLSQTELAFSGWPPRYFHLTGGEPGTRMAVEWDSFESYFDSRDARNRRRIAYNKRKSAEQAIRVDRCTSAQSLEESLRLIQRVEEKYHSPHNPWTRNMLEHMGMVESTFLEARAGSELVGCELILYDNQAQLPTALGHAGAASYDYIEMLYTNICDAIEKGCRFLHWGSGSYEIKRHLGFELEETNQVMVRGTGWLSNLFIVIASLFYH